MADPFIAQINLFAGNFPPRGWAFCDGQILPIASHTALFSLIGTTFGGDGMSTFGLPDLRGRVPVHVGGSTGPGLDPVAWGQKGGSNKNTLIANNLPPHSHPATAVAKCHTAGGDGNSPVGKFWSKDLGSQSGTYHAAQDANMAAGAVEVTVDNSTGTSTPVNNMQPFQGINYIIALVGNFPSRN